MKKSIILTVVSILLVFTLAGCGNDKTEEVADVATVEETSDVEDTSDVVEDTEVVDNSTDEATDEVADETTTCITGIIQDAAMNTIVIKTDDGRELNFFTEDADKTKCQGLLIDSSVDIYYTGEIDGTDTSNVVVVSMEQAEE